MAEPVVEVAPTSAATSARRQEKEQLKRKLRDLQRDEIDDVNEAVEAAADEAEPIEEPSANHAETLVEVESTPVVLETQAQSLTAEEPNTLETEEGEISDDSLFNFYSPVDAQGAPVGESATGDEPEVGSQTPTASDLSGDEDMADPHQDTDLQESQPVLDLLRSPIETPLPDSIQQDTDMADPHQNTDLRESQSVLDLPESLMETQLSDSMQRDTDMAEAVLDSVAPSQPAIDIEKQDEDEDSDFVSEDSESDDEDSQDLDRVLPSRQINAAAADSSQDEGSDPAEASAGSEDYEPSSPILMETAPEIENQGGNLATPAAEFGASTTEPAMKDDVPDDDLAPELQPPTEEQSEVPNQVRQRTCRSSYTLIIETSGTLQTSIQALRKRPSWFQGLQVASRFPRHDIPRLQIPNLQPQDRPRYTSLSLRRRGRPVQRPNLPIPALQRHGSDWCVLI
jgi:hypothetical protein